MPQVSMDRKLSNQAWLEDLHYMVTSLENIHPNLYHAISQEAFQHEVVALTEAIPSMSDNEILVGMLKMIALTQDWHTQIISSNLTEGWFPIRIEALEDGLFITAASRNHASLLGSRVLKIGNTAAAEAFELVRSITAHDNLASQRYFAAMWLSVPTVLNGLHLIPDEDTLRLELQTPNGQSQEVRVAVEAYEADDDLSWFWLREAAPANDCVTVASGVDELPWYWKNCDRFYWLEHLPAYRTVYIGFNLTADDETENFAAFNQRLWDLIDHQQVGNLIIDLRHNLGGDHDILEPLIDGIIQRPRLNQRSHLYIIIGPKNVSASAHCAGWLESRAHPTFVGQPTGARLDQYADPEHIRLPNSQYRLMVAKKYWQNGQDPDTRPWIEPQILVAFNSADYFNLKDPVMDKIFDKNRITNMGCNRKTWPL